MTVPTQKAPKLTAADVVAAVRRHYGAERDGIGPEWSALDEFSLGPGAGRGRADLLLVRAWSGRPKGHERHTIEVKVSRADLLAELKALGKSLPFRAVTHRYYLATPAGLVRDDDPVPAEWGLLEVTARGCRKVREAARQEPEPMPEAALVEAFRRAARAEARIRGADQSDPAARVVDLSRRMKAAERSAQNARAASRRDRDRLNRLLNQIATAGWVCTCGAELRVERYDAQHLDGTSCPNSRYGYAEIDFAALGRRLGLPDLLTEELADRQTTEEAPR